MFHCTVAVNRNHIEAAVLIFIIRRCRIKTHCRVTYSALFGYCDCLKRTAKIITAPEFAFGKYKCIPVKRYDINLTMTAVVITPNYLMSFAYKITYCDILIPVTFFLIIYLPFIFPFSLSRLSTNTSISATTPYNSGGIISPISSLESVLASLESS